MESTSKCESCIWFESCLATCDISDVCDFYDSAVLDEEFYWKEMSYYKWGEK